MIGAEEHARYKFSFRKPWVGDINASLSPCIISLPFHFKGKVCGLERTGRNLVSKRSCFSLVQGRQFSLSLHFLSRNSISLFTLSDAALLQVWLRRTTDSALSTTSDHGRSSVNIPSCSSWWRWKGCLNASSGNLWSSGENNNAADLRGSISWEGHLRLWRSGDTEMQAYTFIALFNSSLWESRAYKTKLSLRSGGTKPMFRKNNSKKNLLVS